MTVVFGTGGVSLELDLLTGGTPAVQITVAGVTSSTTFTLTRLCAGETMTVPGWRERTFLDSDVDTDWAAPLNRPITYSLSTGGAVIVSQTVTLTSATAWLQDPLIPDQAIPVMTSGMNNTGYLTMRADALKALDYDPAQATKIPIMGSAYPVAQGGQVQAGTNVDTSVRSDDPVTAAAFRQMRLGTPILLLRTTTDMVPLPPVCYLLAKVQEQPVTVHMGSTLTRWQMTGDLVAAVLQAAVTGAVTYDEVQQMLSGYTYDQVQAKAAATTYLDWQKNPLIFSTL